MKLLATLAVAGLDTEIYFCFKNKIRTSFSWSLIIRNFHCQIEVMHLVWTRIGFFYKVQKQVHFCLFTVEIIFFIDL